MRILKFKIKRIENMSLTKQLVYVTLVALVIASLIMCFLLPNYLKPYYENNIYAHLEQPAKFIRPETDKMGDDIAFIIITKNGAIYTSNNLEKKVPNLTVQEIIEKASNEKGNFTIHGTKYYYLWGEKDRSKNLIITEDASIKKESRELIRIILPTLLSTIAITIILLFTWSQYVVRKIKKLEKRTKGIITGDKVDGREFIIDDELNELHRTINKVDDELKKKEEYKNMMFQNLSHELKTPISVIQSYLEGVQDEVIDKEEALKVIKEEADSLSKQVKTILKINKIDYMKDNKKYLESTTDIYEVVTNCVKKHSVIRPDVKFNIDIDRKKGDTLFRGTEDMWETILDNILGNFMRYAKTSINIAVKNNIIILENDGEKLEKEMIEKLFLPYVKGEKGQTGLGLSIVKKMVSIFGYDITVANTNNGVKFVIN